MDIWDSFINATKEHFAKVESLIAFDRFHIAQHFRQALDKVRAEVYRQLSTTLDKNPLLKSKHLWLTNSQRIDYRTGKRRAFL
jgi:transposase